MVFFYVDRWLVTVTSFRREKEENEENHVAINQMQRVTLSAIKISATMTSGKIV